MGRIVAFGGDGRHAPGGLGGACVLEARWRASAPHSSCEWIMKCRVFSSADGGHSGANSSMNTRAPPNPPARGARPSMRYDFRNFQPSQPPDIPAFSSPQPFAPDPRQVGGRGALGTLSAFGSTNQGTTKPRYPGTQRSSRPRPARPCAPIDALRGASRPRRPRSPRCWRR